MLARHPAHHGSGRQSRSITCLCACENPVCPEEHVAHPRHEPGTVRASLLRQLPGAIARLRSRRRSIETHLRPS